MKARTLIALMAIGTCAIACATAGSVVNVTTKVLSEVPSAQTPEHAGASTARPVRVVKDRYKLDAPFDKVVAAASQAFASQHVRERRRTESRSILQPDDADGESRDAVALELHDVEGGMLEVRQLIATSASHEDKELLASLADQVAGIPGVGERVPSGSERDGRPRAAASSVPPVASASASAAPPTSASSRPPEAPPKKPKPPKKTKP